MGLYEQQQRAEARRKAEEAMKAKVVKPIEVAPEPTIARGRGRPSSGKVVTTLRLDPDVIEALKAGGPGWQSRANALLRAALKL